MDAVEGWLAFERPLGASTMSDGGWELLRAGRRLQGALKVAIGLDGEPVLRADIAVDAGTEWSQVCHDAIAMLAAADLALDPAVLAGAPPAPPHSPHAGGAIAPALCAARAATLVALCAEAGHAATARPSGVVLVDVGGSEAFRQVEIVPAAGAVRVAVEIVTPAARSEPCSAALAHLLLAASGAVRLARPWVEEREDTTSAGFEVELGPAPDAVALGRAVMALAAACNLCAREADSLVDEAVARAYLALRMARREPTAAPVHPNAP